MWLFSSLSAEGEWDHNASCPGGGDTGMQWSWITEEHYTALWWREEQRHGLHLSNLKDIHFKREEKKG